MKHDKYFKNVDYQSLSASVLNDPDEKERLRPYITNLQKAIKDPTVKNIAVFGKFGAGKTTVINTFLDEMQPHEGKGIKKIRKWIPKRVNLSEIRPLRLSTATFTRTNKRNSLDEAEATKEDNWIALERNLVQQMLYGPKNNSLPNSNFRKIEKTNKLRWLIVAVLVIIFFTTIALLLNWGNLLNLFVDETSLPTLKKILFGVLFLDCSVLTILAFWYLPPYLNSLKLVFGKNELTMKDSKSAFNQHLDEIIYYFSRMKYNLVVFEDIDRADDLNIFEHLRELNQILNNNKAIRETYGIKNDEPSIRFLYAVKEDLFDNPTLFFESNVDSKEKNSKKVKDRENKIAEATTKFFDWTLTVLPRVSNSNASDYLMKVFEEPTSKFKDYLRAVGPYFDNIRILENAVNDLKLFLNLQEGEDLDAEKLFTVLLFKNGFPTEYQKFLRNEGILSQLLRSRYLAEPMIKEFQIKKDELQEKKGKVIKQTELDVVHRYQSIFLVHGAQGNATIRSQDGKAVIQSLAGMDFPSLRAFYLYVRDGNTQISWNRAYSSYNFQSKQLLISDDSFDSDLIFREENLSGVTSSLDLEIQHIQEKIANIESKSITEIARMNPEIVSELLKNTGDARDFLSYAIISGHFDETTEDYFTLFTGERISRNDRAVVLRIRGGRKVPFNQTIDSIPNFVAELIESDYPMHSMALKDVILSGMDQRSHEIYKFPEAFSAAVKQLANQSEELFSENLDELIVDKASDDGLDSLIFQLSIELNYNWGKYEGKQIKKIAPILLGKTEAKNIQDILETSSLLVNFLNNNEWNESLSIMIEQYDLAEQIFGYSKVSLKRLNSEAQANRSFIEFLIKQGAIECYPETLETILLAFAPNSSESLSFAVALQPDNTVLRDFIEKRGEQFLKSELKLELISNETEKSMTNLLKIPEIETDTMVEAIQQYPRQDLDLTSFKLDVEDAKQIPKIIEQIVNKEKAKVSWENLAYLMSFQKSSLKDDIMKNFISSSDYFAKLQPTSGEGNVNVLREVVDAYPIFATNDNEQILKMVTDYSGTSQTENVRNRLIEWGLIDLDKGILNVPIGQPQVIELGKKYLLTTNDSEWSENQIHLFQKLSIEVLVSLIISSDHPLNKLHDFALNEIIKKQSSVISDEDRELIIESIIVNRLVDIDKQAVLALYASMEKVKNQLKLLSELCDSSDVSDQFIVKLLSITSVGGINKITKSHSNSAVNIENMEEITDLLTSLAGRKLISFKMMPNNKIKINQWAKLTKLKKLIN